MPRTAHPPPQPSILLAPAGTPAPMAARRLTMEDLSAALTAGSADFREAPVYGLLFGAVYTFVGALLLLACFVNGWTHLVLPALSGFFLFGPFAALGLYEVSRRRAASLPLRPGDVFFAFRAAGGIQIALFGLLLLLATAVWFLLAAFVYALFFGMTPMSFGTLVETALTSWEGLRFALTGTLVGGVCALAVFSTSVFALPMLLEGRVDLVTALCASLATVRENARVMLAWGIIVVLMIGCGMLFGLVGLLVALPIVGHGTWHLYRIAFPEDAP